uniref:Uncharacterized protein n=1 Tax=Nelumbo nucifera TaxID=4432 RepID=A0A822YTL7_NELNU|nr:TPA_asm: hypothetical protein HUJ06_006632 [Nelumbo nucifera]
MYVVTIWLEIKAEKMKTLADFKAMVPIGVDLVQKVLVGKPIEEEVSSVRENIEKECVTEGGSLAQMGELLGFILVVGVSNEGGWTVVERRKGGRRYLSRRNQREFNSQGGFLFEEGQRSTQFQNSNSTLPDVVDVALIDKLVEAVADCLKSKVAESLVGPKGSNSHQKKEDGPFLSGPRPIVNQKPRKESRGWDQASIWGGQGLSFTDLWSKDGSMRVRRKKGSTLRKRHPA